MREFTPKDAYALMNLLVEQATGERDTIAVVDTSSFVSAGERVLSTGMENVTNALNIVLAKTLISARPYTAKLTLMDAENSGAFSSRMRKISFYSQKALPDGSHNTNLFTNLADGFTNGQNESQGSAQSTKSMWEQHQPEPVELNFGGSAVWQDCITTYDDQLKTAFSDESEFAKFVNGYMTEHANDIEQQKEAWNRMLLLNKIGRVYAEKSNNPTMVVDLTEAYNDEYGTNYTSAELRTTYASEFLRFFTAKLREISTFMTERTVNFHDPLEKIDGSVTKVVLRHTPYAMQRLYLFAPLFNKAKAMVYPEIFNPDRIALPQGEEVSYWQSTADRPAVKVKPAIINSSGVQATGAEVSIPYVVAVLMDKDALMSDFQLERTDTTPLEARKHFRCTWNTFMKGAIDDISENTVVFVMTDDSLASA